MPRSIRGADLVFEALQFAQTKHLFTLSGNQIMPLFDASICSGIDLIHVRHEAAAVHMADAWGRLTGQPGVALVTAGPGFANTLSALYVALMAESPLVLLSGHAPQAQAAGEAGLKPPRAGRGAFQEMAQAEMAGHVVKASWTATDASQLGHDVARAFRTAISGRPGPVHVALPVDLLEASVEMSRDTLPQETDFQPMFSLLDASAADEILDQLAAAASPLVLTGPSAMRGGANLLAKLEDAIRAPVVGMESPRGINDPSLGAFAEVLAEADLILLVGKKLDFTLQFGSEPAISAGCRFIQLDPEMRVLEQTGRVLGDASRLVLTELVDAVPAVERLMQTAGRRGRFEPASPLGRTGSAGRREMQTRAWCNTVREAIAYRPAEWASFRSPAGEPLHAIEVCRAVQGFLSEDEESVLVSDGGEYGQWAQAGVSAGHRVINGPSGAIGSAIPVAATARLAFPNSRIVTLLGDGTFGFQPMEFETAVRHKLPFVAVVGNDACWNAERQIQLKNYGPDRLIGCDLLPTRCDEIVRAMGGHGEFVTRSEELEPALQRAFDSSLPACVNVSIGRIAAPVIRRHARS